MGVPAITTRGMKESDMEKVVELIDRILSDIDNADTIEKVKEEVREMMKGFPLYKTETKDIRQQA